MNLSKKIILLISCFIAIYGKAQELPPILNYTPQDYNGENQNWEIGQSKEKYIYIANNNGLLQFDGANWELFTASENTVLRSLRVVGDKIYTGAYMEFGYWSKNEFGVLEYFSLSKFIEDKLIVDEQFWEIVNFDNWILFQSLNRIYIYDIEEETFQIIEAKERIYNLFKVKNSLYFQKKDEGLFKIELGQEILVANDEIIQNNILVKMFESHEKLLYVTQESGFYFLENGKSTKWDISANSILNNITVYSSIELKNGNIVIGTISKGMYQLNKNGDIITEINQSLGLNNNTVLSLFEDEENNLWLGLDNGVSNINLNSAISVYCDIDGTLGTVYKSYLYKNKLYLGTNQGLFYKEMNSNDPFKFIEGTNGQVWKLAVIDNTLFCGHNKGTFIVDDDKATLIADAMGTWDFEQVNSNKNLIIQGNYEGLNVLEKKNGTWTHRNKIENFDNISSRHIYLNDENELFVKHEYKGVIRLGLTDDFTKVISFEIDSNESKGAKSSMVAYNKELYYISDAGIFKYNQLEKCFDKDDHLTQLFLDNDDFVSGTFIVDNTSNSLWGFTKKGLAHFTPSKLSDELTIEKIWLPVSLRHDVVGFENVSHLNDEKYLIGTSNGYMILDLEKVVKKDFTVEITSIENSQSPTTKLPVSLKSDGDFKSFENNFYFSYSVPEFDKFDEVSYKYRLEGFYDDWSNWSTDGHVSFENLPYGNYTLQVKAQMNNKLSDNIAIYKFKINRPWYINNLMIGVYVIVFLLLFIFIHLFYKRYFNRQKQVLLEKNESELALSKLKSEKEIMNLKNEKLQNEIESKTRELAASTMNIVKKNAFLNTLKKELEDLKDKSSIKPIIKIIDQDMAKNSDWELFQEAFNNADSDFLKKMKSVHPVLTPNDLRLCAYLRLNLSSKEIAPLLNISPRSVEIKRYRLRKKLNLTHGKGLVEYILEI